MGKRKNPDEIERLLGEAGRDLAKGLSVADICRKLGISENTYRWRQRFAPAKPDESRQVEALLTEIERLKTLVAELLLDKKMLQTVAQKNAGELDAEVTSDDP
jgi:transposase-like protein